jgi:hypothetical protein
MAGLDPVLHGTGVGAPMNRDEPFIRASDAPG